jgi:hypothetical protein
MDPVEYVRLQVDHGNDLNVKRHLSTFVEKLCALKFGKKNERKSSKHLGAYLNSIGQTLQTLGGEGDARYEALLYAFGNLHEKCAWSGQPEMLNLVQDILEAFAFKALDSPQQMVQARACWVYGRYGSFEFRDEKHLFAAIEKIANLLHSDHIAVRVDAALALSELLDHETAANFVKPGLGDILKIFLKIMDDIDFEDLVSALRKIVDIFEDDIAPFAISLC